MDKEEFITKSVELLQEKANVCSVASVTEEGYPRICVLKPIGSQGIKMIYFSTGSSSKKIGQYKENGKAGVTFFHGGDSVTLLGEMTIVKDKETKDCTYQNWMDKHFADGGKNDLEYAVLKFVANEATIYIDGAFETYSI
ncbi:hypothetical protein SDC9_192771 [bioreactor metagenome]|uniref:Pyridoxamine 5'-phosphate oxidase N-terminal domain-containing protein n=1 Tax=bioreactor metagenome TaxID=1076179 RepID=A0A645IA57_9ZZZZ